MSLFTSVAAGWLARRILDYGGWLGTFLLTVITTYNNLPPAVQESIALAVQGNWKEITLGALLPLFGLVVSQVQSFRATVKPQVVTPEGKKVRLDELPVGERVETVTAARRVAAQKKPSLLERITRRRR